MKYANHTNNNWFKISIVRHNLGFLDHPSLLSQFWVLIVSLANTFLRETTQDTITLFVILSCRKILISNCVRDHSSIIIIMRCSVIIFLSFCFSIIAQYVLWKMILWFMQRLIYFELYEKHWYIYEYGCRLIICKVMYVMH